jgi:hypothetical protein
MTAQNIIAIALSASLGPVMHFPCKPVGRAGKTFARLQVQNGFRSDRDNLKSSAPVFAGPTEVPTDASGLFMGKEVVVGIKEDIIPLIGRVVPVSDFPAVTFNNVNRRDDTFEVSDITALMFVDVADQTANGSGHIRHTFTEILDDTNEKNAKHGFAMVRSMLQSALHDLQTAEDSYDKAGFVSDENEFFFGYNKSDEELVLAVRGPTKAITQHELEQRIQMSVNENRRNGFTLKAKVAEKAKLEADLARVQKEIDEAQAK